jgi:PAS domain-containing protein
VASEAALKYGPLLFETLPHGVIFYGADEEVVSANPAALRILATTPARMEAPCDQQAELVWLREDGSTCPWPEQPAMLALRTGQTQSSVAAKKAATPAAETTTITTTTPAAAPAAK